MKMKISHVYYKITDDLEVKVTIKSNPFNLNINELFEMGARINKKRAFLFVSKVLGKHIPVSPKKAIYYGQLLGTLYYKSTYLKARLTNGKVKIPERNTFIGFAETATALGHSVFSLFKNSQYIHTTRDVLTKKKMFEFQEEHSHATTHFLYVNNKGFFRNNFPIVFVDDEITTGKTVLNFIKEIHKKYPRKTYHVLTILDWRGFEDVKRFSELENELKIKIMVHSLISGTIEVNGSFNEEFNEVKPLNKKYDSKIQVYEFQENIELLSGKFGTTTLNQNKLNALCLRLAKEIDNDTKRKLVLGTNEFMYIPMKIATNLSGEVMYHSTTRSPIIPLNKPNYAIKNKFYLRNIYDNNIDEYLYNVPKNYYDTLYIMYEKKGNKKLLDETLEELKKLGIKNINVCFFRGD